MYAPQADQLPPMTEAEYLAFEDDSEIKHEFRQGRVVAMTKASAGRGFAALVCVVALGEPASDSAPAGSTPKAK
jgi:Uma2 family endonuclease